MQSNIARPGPRELVRAILALVIMIAPVSLFLVARPAAGAPEQTIVRLEIKHAGGSISTAAAVRIATDRLLMSCGPVVGATAVDIVLEKTRIPMALSAIDPLDNVCSLSGTTDGALAALAQRSKVRVGNRLTLYVPDSNNKAAWNISSASIGQKLYAGRNRAILVEEKDLSEPNTIRSLPGAIAFDAEGNLVGIVSALPGAPNMVGAILIEDPDHLSWSAKTSPASVSKAGQKSTRAVSQLTSYADKLGLTLTLTDLASELSRTFQTEKLLQLADRWQAEDPENPQAYVLSAGALSRLKFADRSAADLEKAVKLAPDYLPVQSAGVFLKDQQDRKIEAELAAKSALSLPSTDSLDDGIRVELLAYIKEYEKAIALARDLVKEEPKGPNAVYALCYAEYRARHFETAITECKVMVETVPNSIKGWSVLGYSYLARSQFEDALEAGKRALQINADVASSWNLVGLAYEAKGDAARVSEAEERLKELDAKQSGQFKKARLSVACAREVRNKPLGYAYGTAIAICGDAIRENPTSANPRANLGWALVGDKRIDEGIAAYEEAIHIDEKYTFAWRQLGYAAGSKGDSRRARNAYEHLRQLDSKAADEMYGRLRTVIDK